MKLFPVISTYNHPPSEAIREHTSVCFEHYTFGRMICANGMIIYTMLECGTYSCEQISWSNYKSAWEHVYPA